MTRSILRTVLTMLALVLLFAGSFSLNRASAQDEVVGACQTYCGCGGGPSSCCRIEYPNGPKVYCGMHMPQ